MMTKLNTNTKITILQSACVNRQNILKINQNKKNPNSKITNCY